MIEIEDVRVAYGDRIAVDDVTFRVAPGEFFGLLGPNGAGKTSLIGALCGLVTPQAGRVVIDGLDTRRDRTGVARRLGLVPQDLAFYLPLTARQNLVFFGRVQGLLGAPLKAAVERVLELVQLTDRADDRAGTFSGGMKRRLNVAVGLLHTPAVLVLDEPTVGVDAQSRNALLECFASIAGDGTTVLYTTHLMEEAERLCDRVAIMDAGRIVTEGAPAALVERFGTGGLSICFDRSLPESLPGELLAAGVANEIRCDGNRLELIAERPEQALAMLTERAAASGLAVESLDLPKPSLERVFLRLTGRRVRDGEDGP